MSDLSLNTLQQALPLQTEQIVPAFTLPDTDGMPYGPLTYKQRENLLLFFLPDTDTDDARQLLHMLARHYKDIREEICTPLVITTQTVIKNLLLQEVLRLPFSLLADPRGTVFPQYTINDAGTQAFLPYIALADRYNALYQQWVGQRIADLPAMAQVRSSLRYLNTLCTP